METATMVVVLVLATLDGALLGALSWIASTMPSVRMALLRARARADEIERRIDAAERRFAGQAEQWREAGVAAADDVTGMRHRLTDFNGSLVKLQARMGRVEAKVGIDEDEDDEGSGPHVGARAPHGQSPL